MGLKIKLIIIISLFLLINISDVQAHVCSDVLPGGSQYNPGCEPVIITVPSANQNGNTISLTINVRNKKTLNGDDGERCGNPYSGSLTNVGISSIEPIPDCSDCFSMNNPGSYTIASNANRNYNVVVTIDGSATPGTYNLRFIVSLNEGVDRYIDVEDIVVEGGGCTPDCDGKYCGDDGCGGDCGTCGGDTPVCDGSDCVECVDSGDCNDGDLCTSDSCSGGVCSNPDLANGATCGSGGHCCSGTCDTSVGNSAYVSGCRAGPSCVGSSWEWTISNNGGLCGGYTCRECNNGL